MNWTKDEEDRAHKAAEAAFVGVAAWDADVRADCMRDGMTTRLHHVADAIMALAVELVAARGGTMSAHDLTHTLEWVRDHGLAGPADKFSQHIAAQGARIAALEAEVERQKTRANGHWDTLLASEREIAGIQHHVSDLEKSLENARRSEEAWRRRVEAAAEALSGVLPGEVGRLDLLARIEALKAEVARLTPSGEVAEDEKTLHRILEGVPRSTACTCRKLGSWDTGSHHPQCDAAVTWAVQDALTALSRLATKAQGHDAALVLADRLRLTIKEERLALANTTKERDDWQRKALERDLQVVTLTAERDAAVASAQRWEESFHSLNNALTQRVLDLEKERDAAVADNAALLVEHQRIRNLLLYPIVGLAEARAEVLRVGLKVVTKPHPGADLLKRMQEQAPVMELLKQYQRHDEENLMATLQRLLDERSRIAHMVSADDHAKAVETARHAGIRAAIQVAHEEGQPSLGRCIADLIDSGDES